MQVIPPLTIAQDVNAAPFEAFVNNANSLAYVGTPKPIIHKDVIGEEILSTRQANFIFLVRRSHSTLAQNNEDMENFCSDFELWVEEQNFLAIPERILLTGFGEWQDLKGKIPRFGDIDFDEYMWADNAQFFGINQNPDTVDYQVQLHIQYQIKYKLEEW